MVRMHLVDVKGSLVRLLAEVQELHLSIIHANAMPFTDSTLIINIMAKACSLPFLHLKNGKFIVLSRNQFY
jgi:hypothetical protein